MSVSISAASLFFLIHKEKSIDFFCGICYEVDVFVSHRDTIFSRKEDIKLKIKKKVEETTPAICSIVLWSL